MLRLTRETLWKIKSFSISSETPATGTNARPEIKLYYSCIFLSLLNRIKNYNNQNWHYNEDSWSLRRNYADTTHKPKTTFRSRRNQVRHNSKIQQFVEYFFLKSHNYLDISKAACVCFYNTFVVGKQQFCWSYYAWEDHYHYGQSKIQ